MIRVLLQDIFRVFDSLNYLDNLKFGLDAVMDAGGVAEGTICYTGDISDPRKKKAWPSLICMLSQDLQAFGCMTEIRTMSRQLMGRSSAAVQPGVLPGDGRCTGHSRRAHPGNQGYGGRPESIIPSLQRVMEMHGVMIVGHKLARPYVDCSLFACDRRLVC